MRILKYKSNQMMLPPSPHQRFRHVWCFVTPWTVAHQAPLSMGFSRQEYLSELPCPYPENLPDPVIEPVSLMYLAFSGRFLTTNAILRLCQYQICFWIVIKRTEKDPDAGKDCRQKEKRATEDETVRQHHWLNRHEFEQTTGDREGQGSLACCSPWGHIESDTI